MKNRWIILAFIIILLLSGCNGEPEVTEVKMAVLPVLDALPMYVAEAQGYFEAEGLSVELIPVASAPERDALMQAGQVDAILNEIVSTLYYNQAEEAVVIVRFLRIATEEFPVFRILAAKDSGISSVEDLKGVEIGLSEGTVIEYTTDRILENAGLTDEEIVGVAIPKIPDRIALLASGELLAANLPDPAATAALAQGAVLIIDDTTIPDYSSSVISFDAEMVRNNPETVRRFLNAIERAVEDINADKDQWNELLVEKGLLAEVLVGKYTIPDFPTASVPSQAQYDDCLEWTISKGIITGSAEYAVSVTDEYLP